MPSKAGLWTVKCTSGSLKIIYKSREKKSYWITTYLVQVRKKTTLEQLGNCRSKL